MSSSFQTFLADLAGLAGQLPGPGFKGAAPLLLALLAVAVAGLWLWRRPGRKGRTNVTARRAFSQADGLLWSRLNTVLPDHVVLLSVPLTRFISVRQDGGLGRNQRKLDALSVDFGIFRSDGTVSSVVLLEDNDAALTRRQIKLRRKLLDRAGVKVVSWASKPLPSLDMISRQLKSSPLQFSDGEPGNAQRGLGLARSGSDEAVAPDTRLAASLASS